LRARDDGDDAGMLTCSVRLKTFDFRVSVRRSQNGGVECMRESDIVHETAQPANQFRIFAALDSSAYKLTDRHNFSPTWISAFLTWTIDRRNGQVVFYLDVLCAFARGCSFPCLLPIGLRLIAFAAYWTASTMC